MNLLFYMALAPYDFAAGQRHYLGNWKGPENLVFSIDSFKQGHLSPFHNLSINASFSLFMYFLFNLPCGEYIMNELFYDL